MGNCFTVDDSSPENAVVLCEDHPRSTASIPLNSPEKIDPRLVSLLDFSKQLHGRRKELFSKVIPLHGDEILEVFKKIRKEEETIGRPGFQLILKRSHSAGAAEAVAKARGVDLTSADLKNERFKVKTFDAADKPPPAGQGGGAGGGKSGGGK